MRDVQELLERTGTVMLTCGVEHARRPPRAQDGARARRARSTPSASRSRSRAASATSRAPARASGSCTSPPSRAASREARAAIERETTTGFDAIPEGTTRRALQSFLELYGDRAVREAELSTPRWKEDPRPVLRDAPRRAPYGRRAGRGDACARAKAQADAEMAKLVPKLNIVEQTVIRHLVARAQRAARLRERMRAWVTRVLGMLREAALDADRRLLRRESGARRRLARARRFGLAAGERAKRLLPDDRRGGRRSARGAHRPRAARAVAARRARARPGASRPAGDVRRRASAGRPPAVRRRA